MPVYRKKYAKSGKVYYKKRPRNIYYRRTANKALRIAKWAASRINAESNILDNVHNGTTVGMTMNFQLLNGCTRGDGNDNREGNNIRMKSVYVRLHNIMSQDASSVFSVCRLMIILDKQPNAATPSTANVLENTSVPVASPLEKDYSTRFDVLWDKVITMSKTGAEGRFVKKYIPLDIKVRYNENNNGDITDINTNALYFCIVTNATAATLEPSFYSNVRLRFVDN